MLTIEIHVNSVETEPSTRAPELLADAPARKPDSRKSGLVKNIFKIIKTWLETNQDNNHHINGF